MLGLPAVLHGPSSAHTELKTGKKQPLWFVNFPVSKELRDLAHFYSSTRVSKMDASKESPSSVSLVALTTFDFY